ncbi:MAG TPA: hypothetical protein PKX93_06425, partial [bacterium]|nr:hypothetical protein [bacterium]
NEGLIVANLGKVVIGGGESFTLNFDGTGLVNFAISAPAEGTPGTVLIPTSQVTDIVRQVVNTPGLIEAGQIIEENGVTRLVAASGTAINAGTIQAAGGSAILKASQATVLSDGATLDAGTGYFEISAPNFLLRGTTIGGSGLIDPTNLYVVPDTTATGPNEVNETYIESQSVAGVNMVYEADDLINIGDLPIGSDGVITGGSGNITFRISDDGDNAGVISFANNTNEIRTTSGNITLDALTNAANGYLQNIGKLTTSAGGSVSLRAGTGGVVLANDIALNTGSGVGTLTVTTTGTLEILQASDIDTNGAAMTVDAPAVSINGTITTDNGTVTFNNLATGFEVNDPTGSINAGSGDVNIYTAAGTTVDLGFVGTSGLKISDNTLDNITTTGTLRIGNAGTGDIYIGAVSQGSTDVVITSGGSILDDGTLGTAIGAQTLSLVADSVGTLAAPVGVDVTSGTISVDTTSGGAAGNIYLIEPTHELEFSKLTFTTDAGSVQTIGLTAAGAQIDVDTATSISDNLILTSDAIN